MRSEALDFSPRIRESQVLNDPAPQPFLHRLHKALEHLCVTRATQSDNLTSHELLVPYARGYLDYDPLCGEDMRLQAALARVFLFIRMESGQTVPYLYKKLDQDLSARSPRVFDDGERGTLKFTRTQLIEATLLARKFGIEYPEESLTVFCEEIANTS